MTVRGIILVAGATGAQGGGVARHLLAGGEFAVRCLTRNPNSEKAKALRAAGAEVVAGDLGAAESLRAALRGCYGAFGVTNFWEHFADEYRQGKNLVDAVAGSGIEHFVFSTLPHAKKITGGELDVPHLDIKGQLEEYARGLGLPATFIHVAFYYDNFLTFFPPQKQADGAFAFGFPQGDTPLAGVAVEDVGGVVAAIFDRPEAFRGRTVGVVGDDLSPTAYADIMTRVLGKKVVYQYIPREVFASFGFPGADDLANMFEFNRRFILNRQADLAESRALYPSIQAFEPWLRANRDRFQNILQG
jgi:uncharacterized protein YbjT (DUF2867 family)